MTEAANEALKNCPMCGSDALTKWRRVSEWAVCCENCGCNAPSAGIWNMRCAPTEARWNEVKDLLPPECEEVLLDHIIDDHKHTLDIAWQKGGEWSFPWIGRLAKAQCAPVWPVRWQQLPALVSPPLRKCWRCGNPMAEDRPFCPASEISAPCNSEGPPVPATHRPVA